MLTVVCMLWSDRAKDKNYTYGPDHVRTLRNMVARHLNVWHRFVCITDDELDEDIETIPLDWSKHIPATRFLKLQLFKPDIGDVLGEWILYLDLDAVIVDDITPLVAFESVTTQGGWPHKIRMPWSEPVIFWQNPRHANHSINSSIFFLRAGSRPHYWTKFNRNVAVSLYASSTGMTLAEARAAIRDGEWRGGSDQLWLTIQAKGEAKWGPGDGIYGAGGLEVVDGKTILPDDARIVFTPGNREPGQPEMRTRHPWITEHYR